MKVGPEEFATKPNCQNQIYNMISWKPYNPVKAKKFLNKKGEKICIKWGEGEKEVKKLGFRNSVE